MTRARDENTIAIIGMAGRFPEAPDLDIFWSNLVNGVEAIRRFSEQELSSAGVPRALSQRADYVPARPVLTGIDEFDAEFFGVGRPEAELMDPQQRVFLECAWEALEDAGHDPAAFAGRIGVFAGAAMSTYYAEVVHGRPATNGWPGLFQAITGNEKEYLATRLAYALDLRGPAISVQSACSTSLVAVHTACSSLLARECDMAIAGGVTIRLPHYVGYVYEPRGLFSPDGHCRPFDASARGTVFGSGAGVVVLRRLSDALADGDPIRATILGSAINNDGARKAGFAAPSQSGQCSVITEALAVASVEPGSIQYIEAHATGTELGDAIELAALSDALCGAGTHSCAVGSVKSNVGHLEAAAGITGLIKTVLALEHRQIPPTLHVQQPSPRVDLTHSPLRIITELCAWQAADTPRRAGVSSFGVGGTNAHVVLEEAPPSAAGCRTPAPSPSTVLLPVSARDPVALTALARAFAERLERATQAEFVDLVYSAGARRAHHIYRYAVVGSSPAELAHELRCRTQLPRSRSTAAYGKLRVVFVFPDLEALGPAACAELDEPSFQEALAATERAGGERAFGVALGIAALWRSWGVEPDSIVGFGAGQLAAAHCSGLMSLADAVEMLRARKVAGSRWPETRATGARTVPCWSPLHQRWLQASDLEPEYWRRALTDPQDIRTTSLKLMHKGGRLFIEISPHSVLLERIRQASADARVKAHSVGSTLLDGRERRGMLEALGEVYEAGYSVQWRRVAAAGSCIRLPRYPWQRQRYWLDSQRVVPAAQEAPPEHLV